MIYITAKVFLKSSNGKSLTLPAIPRRKVQFNTYASNPTADDHFSNLVLELSNIDEHRSKPTYMRVTSFNPLRVLV